MNFKLNIITASLLLASAPVLSANFAVSQANTTKVEQQNYQCQRCEVNSGYRGNVSVAAGYISRDDVHAANALGTDQDGFVATPNANVKYQNNDGYQAHLQTHQLGYENSFAEMSAGKAGLFNLDAGYQLITTYQSGDAQSNLYYDQGTLVNSAQPYGFELSQQREKFDIEADVKQDNYQGYVQFETEDKSGYTSSSIITPSPVNIGLVVDSTTDSFTAGAILNGANWITELSYFGSQYQNNAQDLSLTYQDDVYAAAPDNEAHQIALSGQYQLDSTVMSGRFIVGRMIQDDDLISMNGNPIQNWDGEIETTDATLKVSSMLSSRLRVGGSYDYSNRENNSSVFEFLQYTFNDLNDTFKENIATDIERSTYKLNAKYRISQDYRLQAGYDREEINRSYSAREETHDDTLWSKLSIRAVDNVIIDIKAEHSNRDGSNYQTDELTSSEENALMRKYYLANRTRNNVELSVNHTPLNWLSVDISAHYAKDDYDDTLIGLTESEDYGVNLNLNLNISKHVNLYGFASQQWINSAQASSQSYSTADWFTDIEDEFINIGTGISYGGLMQDKLTLGADYLFSNSNSDTYITSTGTSPYGDYYSYNHSTSLYANYSLSNEMALKLTYRYERYYDTDDAQMSLDEPASVITLGELNHNYNAHQVMLNFSYLL
ncbi:MtrB/PioB family decaheme-associated outer membrane protein [Shewanella livingstonensis]|uniref:MtrB/PioB family decaheme-associated outer membrane protein n=1 Tax=Shewanella livingstonensis TaxID=150120 RepID=A0A3G8LZR0_9GAMM|nr:MtrB/PioB family decaheme-associated outer membrane protein [Shewanella livingstonensis]AZG74924.1 MtrB/PioB family decaheme-associated outer membrane protein [Shewanella livingstonensis]